MKHDEVVQSAFAKVYADGKWGNGSGPGSLPKNTVSYRALLENFMADNGIRTVTDLGCGDWQISRHVNWSGVQYTGLDAVPDVIANNLKAFGSVNIAFDVSTQPGDLKGGDLLIAKEVLQHLPNALIVAYLEAIKTRYRFALVTNSIAPGAHFNHDIAAGACRPLKPYLSPFFASGAVIHRYGFLADGVYYSNEVFLMVNS
ncbi:MAG: hypothetical protein B7Z80_18415 [Rhodospirillales bacterium 20-64-7]|nr:MAG: hypothetical protein B7Z80_18415 [Rhodospirillales bacterium 20-64-7]